MRATAWGVVAAGVLAPLVRKRVKAPPLAMQAAAFAAPVGLAVAVRALAGARRGGLQPADVGLPGGLRDPPRRRAGAGSGGCGSAIRSAIDRVLGLGELPTVRLQRALACVGPGGPRWRTLDSVLVWAHWSWFMVPHGGLLYILLRHPRRFDRAAVLTYAVFDIGAMIYWVLPTAPPWYAAAAPEGGGPGNGGSAHDTSAGGGGEAIAIASPPRVGARVAYARGGVPGDEPAQRRALAVRRMMVEYGEDFWEDSWGPLYSVLGGNPLAAMPSLHFATSVMAAQLLAETGPVAGALGWSYACTLGFALVYLGEHYAVDLLAGAALSAAVGRLGPRARPLLVRCAEAVAALEAAAHGAS